MATTSTDTAADQSTLKETPLAAIHRERGAKMVPFAGWSMPLHYGSIVEEHHQVRRSGGIFDVSHMGRLMFTGKDARAFLDRVCTRQVLGMQDGQARYGMICNEQGGCRDDVLVYRVSEGAYMMVCNASNRAKLLEHFAQVKQAEGFIYKLEDFTESSVMVAVQGPRVMEVLGAFSSAIPELKRYRFVRKELFGLEMIVSRTGYTGEDGVEVIFRTDGFIAKTAMKMLVSKLDERPEISMAGLGARDSLRLEASMALYGHELEEDVDPLSAGLHFAVKIDKGGDAGRFIGQDVIEKIAEEGPKRTLVGLELEGRRAARQGATVVAGSADIGTVTSGCLSPTLEKSIAMASVDAAHADEGTTLAIRLGRNDVPATVVAMPFYKPG